MLISTKIMDIWSFSCRQSDTQKITALSLHAYVREHEVTKDRATSQWCIWETSVHYTMMRCMNCCYCRRHQWSIHITYTQTIKEVSTQHTLVKILTSDTFSLVTDANTCFRPINLLPTNASTRNLSTVSKGWLSTALCRTTLQGNILTEYLLYFI